MTKKISRLNYIFLSIVVVIGLLLSFCSFNVPFSNYRYNGFLNSIPLGTDIAGGHSAVFNVISDEHEVTDSDVDEAVRFLNNVITSQGYYDAVVVKQGDRQLRFEISNNNDPVTLIETLGSAEDIYMRSSSDGTEHVDGEITGADILDAYAIKTQLTQSSYGYGVNIVFTSEGAEKFETLTSSIASGSQVLAVYMGDELFTQVQVTEAQTGGSTFISGGSIVDEASANNFALQILVGSLDTKLELDSSSQIPALLGEYFLLLSGIGIGVLCLAYMVYFIVKYRELGLLASFSLVIFGVLYLFFLQALPISLMTLGGIIGVVVGLAFNFVAHYMIFKNIDREYGNGKKIPLSVKTGFQKSTMPIVDMNVVAIIATVAIWFFGNAFVKSFCLSVCLASCLTLFTALLVTRGLVKWYLPFNSTKANKMGLTRKENVNEI